MRNIILASTSPRRKEILSKLKIPFLVEASNYIEDMTLDLTPIELAIYLSRGKAQVVAKNHDDAIIIAADSFVVFKGKKLGKPHSTKEAKEMLLILNGKMNEVITGTTIIDAKTQKTESFIDISKVYLKKLTEKEIDNYIKTGEPMDKAGAYAIQEIGASFVEKIDGDFLGAMGLPLSKLVDALKRFDVYIL